MTDEPTRNATRRIESDDAMVRARLALLTDEGERIAAWSSYLVAFRKARDAVDSPNPLLSEIPEDVREAMVIRLKAIASFPNEPTASPWTRFWRRAVGEISVPLDEENLRRRLRSKYLPQTAGEVLYDFALRLGLKGALIAAVGAVAGVLGHMFLDRGRQIVFPARPVVVDIETDAIRDYDAAKIGEAVSGLWMSKFIVDNLAGLVGRDCYDTMLAGHQVPSRCVRSWTSALTALRQSQRSEGARMKPVIDALKDCEASGQISDSIPPVSFRSNMDTRLFRPESVSKDRCQSSRIQAEDYVKLLSDLLIFIGNAERAIQNGETSCRVVLRIENAGADNWRPYQDSTGQAWSLRGSSIVLRPDFDAGADATVTAGLGEHGQVTLAFLVPTNTNVTAATIVAPNKSLVQSSSRNAPCPPPEQTPSHGRQSGI